MRVILQVNLTSEGEKLCPEVFVWCPMAVMRPVLKHCYFWEQE